MLFEKGKGRILAVKFFALIFKFEFKLLCHGCTTRIILTAFNLFFYSLLNVHLKEEISQTNDVILTQEDKLMESTPSHGALLESMHAIYQLRKTVSR